MNKLLLFLQMFQFRLGGKATIISCKGHKEEASVEVTDITSLQIRRDCMGLFFTRWYLHFVSG